jgi:hypothetical protein
MKFRVFFTLTLVTTALAACSSADSTGTTSASSSSGATATSSSTSGAGGSGGAGSTSSTGGASTSSSTAGSGGMAAFALTSTGFTEGTAIPVKYACSPGANGSPDLSWTAGPIGTLSYAVVLTDKSNNLLHWVIWDIPGGTTSLPEGVEKKANPAIPPGARQVKSYDNQTFGYLGPCPPSLHTYEFAVFALDVATLPGVTTASTRAQVNTEILKHDLASTTLTGTYTP